MSSRGGSKKGLSAGAKWGIGIAIAVIVIVIVVVVVLLLVRSRASASSTATNTTTTDTTGGGGGGNNTTGCQSSADCTSTPATPVCDDSSGDCVQCLLDPDCIGVSGLPHCDTDLTCKECLNDAHCTGNGGLDVCNASNTCEPCTIPAGPSVVSASLQPFTSITVTWTPVPGALGYTIHWGTSVDWFEWDVGAVTSLVGTAGTAARSQACCGICSPCGDAVVYIRAATPCGTTNWGPQTALAGDCC